MKTEEEQKISDTPQTDAVCWQEGHWNKTECVTAYFARNLERERDAANKELHEKIIQFDKLFDVAVRMRIERDAALRELEGFKNYTK